jgi:hypothetical protein
MPKEDASSQAYSELVTKVDEYWKTVEQVGEDSHHLLQILKEIEMQCKALLGGQPPQTQPNNDNNNAPSPGPQNNAVQGTNGSEGSTDRDKVIGQIRDNAHEERERILMVRVASLRDRKDIKQGKLPQDIPADLVPTLAMALKDIAPEKDNSTGTLKKTQHENNSRGQTMLLHHAYERNESPEQRLRLLRFVKAVRTQTNSSGSTLALHATNGRYVEYTSLKKEIDGVQIAQRADAEGKEIRKNIVEKIRENLQETALWSYDGPAKENWVKTPGEFKNFDEPGQKGFQGLVYKPDSYPYIIASEFIMVIYDEAAQSIVDVKTFGSCLAAWTQQDRKMAEHPDNSLI